MLRPFLELVLGACARRVTLKYKPEVVAVTGSVGKSSTTRAIAAVLGRTFAVRATAKNYNNELGVPLSILGLPSGGRSVLKWAGVLWDAAMGGLFGMADFPKVLALEMGADHPGDIAYLTSIAAPKIGVITAIGEAHAEFFGSIDAIAKEKRRLIEGLPKDGAAVLNRDDGRAWAMREKTGARILSYGFADDADVRALETSMSYGFEPGGECGTHFKLAAGGGTVPVFLSGSIGRQNVYAALAAAAVGLAKGMNLVEISDGLRDFVGAPGRQRCIGGIKHSLIIDDTYNASPTSTTAALDALAEIPLDASKRKFAVLGDMLELGPLSGEGHAAVGKRAVEAGVDVLVLVGARMHDAEKTALAAGASRDKVFHFSGTDEAGRFVQERMRQGDIVLVKGSRGMHMEKVVKELMNDPLLAPQLLVDGLEQS